MRATDIAERLEELLNVYGWTHATAAQRAGVRREQMSHWLAGRHKPHQTTLTAWANRERWPQEIFEEAGRRPAELLVRVDRRQDAIQLREHVVTCTTRPPAASGPVDVLIHETLAELARAGVPVAALEAAEARLRAAWEDCYTFGGLGRDEPLSVEEQLIIVNLERVALLTTIRSFGVPLQDPTVMAAEIARRSRLAEKTEELIEAERQLRRQRLPASAEEA